MVDINPVNKNKSVGVSSSGSVSQIKTTTPQNYYDGLAKQWAIGENLVQGFDYSSKHYAQEASKSAQNAKVHIEQIQAIKIETIDEIDTTKSQTIQTIQNTFTSTIDEITEIKNNAIINIEETKQETLEDIESETKAQIKNIQSTGFYMQDDKLFFINSKGEVEEFKSGDENTANKDLSNLTEKGKKQFLGNSNITNCITEIPQRIKLELNNGVLTLKAGSEVIIPNGFEEDGTTPKFDYVTVENDLNLTADTYNYQEFVFYNVSSKTLARQNANMVASGSSNVLGQASTYCYCYNTSENKFYTTSNGGTNWSEISISLPICIATKNNSLYTSIDQVFNGMGYIGSTIWVDKGVRGLIPNGRNEDGTLNNYVVKTNKLRFGSNIGTSTASPYWYIWSNLSKDNLPVGYRNGVASTTYFQDEKPTLNNGVNYAVWYSPAENLVRFTNNAGTTWEKSDYCLVASYTCQNGVVTGFKPRTTFIALDYNDKQQISTWAMPSNKYINLTLGASGTTYTAPANGYFCHIGTFGTTAGYVLLDNTNTKLITQSYGGNNVNSHVYLPAKKGDVVKATYNNTKSGAIYFVYAEGEV